MGLATIDPHNQKEHTKLEDFVKLGMHFDYVDQ